MPTVLDIAEKVENIAHELSARVDTLDQEQKRNYDDLTSKTGKMPAEARTIIDRMQTDLDVLMDKIKEMQVEAKRPHYDSPVSWRDGNAHHKAFMKAMKLRGALDLMEEDERSLIEYSRMSREMKALYAADATTGGFFAATDFLNELMQYRLLISPMRTICRRQQTSGERVQLPALANDASAYWAAEQQTFTDSSDPTLSMINIPVHEIRGLLKVSHQNLEDSLFNLEDLIKTRLGLKFAQTEGQAFIAGNGNGKPRGVLSYPIKATTSYAGGSAGKNNVTDAIPYVASGVANNITADSIVNTLMDLKSYYAPNCTWVFTRSTLGTLRLFKDSMNRPLWQPFAAAGLPATIYDRPYVEMPDMPEINTQSYPILLGDFQYYMIVDRLTMNVQQLNELYAAYGLVGFIARMRVGGDVLLPESFRLLKDAVS